MVSEMIKPAYQQPIDNATYQKTIDIFEKLMTILHPFMPSLLKKSGICSGKEVMMIH